VEKQCVVDTAVGIGQGFQLQKEKRKPKNENLQKTTDEDQVQG
jgi:hypothetical protein